MYGHLIKHMAWHFNKDRWAEARVQQIHNSLGLYGVRNPTYGQKNSRFQSARKESCKRKRASENTVSKWSKGMAQGYHLDLTHINPLPETEGQRMNRPSVFEYSALGLLGLAFIQSPLFILCASMSFHLHSSVGWPLSSASAPSHFLWCRFTSCLFGMASFHGWFRGVSPPLALSHTLTTSAHGSLASPP